MRMRYPPWCAALRCASTHSRADPMLLCTPVIAMCRSPRLHAGLCVQVIMRDRLVACLCEHIKKHCKTVKIEHDIRADRVTQRDDSSLDVHWSSEAGKSGTITTPFMVRCIQCALASAVVVAGTTSTVTVASSAMLSSLLCLCCKTRCLSMRPRSANKFIRASQRGQARPSAVPRDRARRGQGARTCRWVQTAQAVRCWLASRH